MAHWTKILSDNTTINKTIVVDDEVVGNVSSWIADEGRAIGYWLAKDQWGKGVATEAVRQFVADVEERPLYATVAAHNKGSIRVLEKCGFELVKGPYPGHGYGGMEVVDELLLALRGSRPA